MIYLAESKRPKGTSVYWHRSFRVALLAVAELRQQDICLTEFRRLLKTFFSLRLGVLRLCFNGAGYKHSYLLTYLLVGTQQWNQPVTAGVHGVSSRSQLEAVE